MDVEKMVTAVRVRDAITKRTQPAAEDTALLRLWVDPIHRSCDPDDLAKIVMKEQLQPCRYWPGRTYKGVFKQTA